MSDHETTLRGLADGIYIDASLPLLHLAPHEKAACLAGADALRRTWQPIETAPKKADVLVAWAYQPTWPPQVLIQSANGGWFDEDGADYAMPTHWMPLPDAPKETGRG